MNTAESIVITGLSGIFPFGRDLQQCSDYVFNQAAGSTDENGWSYDYGTTPVGIIPDEFMGQDMDPKERRFINKAGLLVCDVVGKCIADAGLSENIELLSSTGIISGSGFGCISSSERMTMILHEKGPAYIDPLEFPWTSHNFPISAAAIKYGLKGPITSLVQSISSGLHALIYSAMQIMKGPTERVIVVAFDEMNKTLYSLLEEKGYLDCSLAEDAARAPVRITEGCVALLLESRDAALKRKARTYGELVKWDITSRSGKNVAADTLLQSIQAVLDDAKTWLVCNGSGHSAEKDMEDQVMKQLKRDNANVIDSLCFKQITGNGLAASPILEAALLLANKNVVVSGESGEYDKTYVFNSYGMWSNIISVAIRDTARCEVSL